MASFREMQDRVADATGRPPNSHRGEVARLVNDAYLAIVERSRLNTRTEIRTLTIGQADYSISTDFLIDDLVALRSVTYTLAGDTVALNLLPVSFDELSLYRASVQTTSGTGMTYAFWGQDTLAIWPSPATADVLAVTFDYRPDVMSLDDDTPDAVPVEFHYVIEDGAIARSARYKPALKELASEANARYQQGLADLVRHRNRRGGAMPRRVVVGQKRHVARRGNSIFYTGDA